MYWSVIHPDTVPLDFYEVRIASPSPRSSMQYKYDLVRGTSQNTHHCLEERCYTLCILLVSKIVFNSSCYNLWIKILLLIYWIKQFRLMWDQTRISQSVGFFNNFCCLRGVPCNYGTSLWSVGNCITSSCFLWIKIVFAIVFVWKCYVCCIVFRSGVLYAENFHGEGVHSVAYGGIFGVRCL